MKKVFYNNQVSFDTQSAAEKTEAEFVAHELHVGLTEDQLKEAYALCVAAVGKAPKKSKAEKAEDKA